MNDKNNHILSPEDNSTLGVLNDKNLDADMQELRDVRAALLRNEAEKLDIDHEWMKFNEKCNLNVKEQSKKPKAHKNKIVWMTIGAAIGAAACLLCVLMLAPLNNMEETIVAFKAIQQNNHIEYTSIPLNADNKKAAGKAEKRYLNNDTLDLRKMAQSKVSMDEEQMISTPRGKDFKIVLSDGTEVLLNAESRLSFPKKFNGKIREVTLEGEAYFKIAKDKTHPFIVKSRTYQTKALGTEFNVKAYSDDVHVTLIQGSVAVTDGASKAEPVILEPGQDVCTINDKLVVTDANVNAYIQWKDGYFYFDNEPLVDVLMELGRWYNIDIEIKSRTLLSYRLHFIADRNATLEEAVERLDQFSYLSATLKGKRLTIDRIF